MVSGFIAPWSASTVASASMESYIILLFVHTMIYTDMPLIIPVLATVYLVAIYLLLMVAQRTKKSSQYLANSLTDIYATSAGLTPNATSSRDEVEQSPASTVQEVSSPPLT